MQLLGFVDPDGNFYQCKKYGHEGLADTLLEKFYGIKSNLSIESLCEYGWMVIQSQYVGFILNKSMKLSFTKKQEQFLVNNFNVFTYGQIKGIELAYELSNMQGVMHY